MYEWTLIDKDKDKDKDKDAHWEARDEGLLAQVEPAVAAAGQHQGPARAQLQRLQTGCV
jgi:hypothetical protein